MILFGALSLASSVKEYNDAVAYFSMHNLSTDGLSRKETLDCPVTCTILHSDDPYAENTLENPDAIVPVTSVIEPSSWYKNTLTTSIGPRTFVVFTMEY